jgi:TonB family protein
MDVPGPAATSEVIPPLSKPGNVPRVEDYPDVSVRLLEQGEVILKSLIDENGKILDVSILETSGSSRLDQSAMNAVRRRFAYEPASVDGRPIAVTFTTYVSFEIGSSRSISRPLFCHNRPVFSAHDRHIPQRSGRPAWFSEWLLTSDGSRIDDALLLTKRGWLQVAPTALVQMKFPPNYRVVRRADQQQCWVHFQGDIPP